MISEKKIGELARVHGTPLYIFDKEELCKRIYDIQKILGQDIDLCYAMKANPFLVDTLKSLVPKFEVCSQGEFAICKREKVDMSSIVLSGVYKKLSDIEYVMDECGGVGVYTVESIEQLNILCDCAKKRMIQISVLLRLTSKNQFGLDEAEIEKIVQDREKFNYVNIIGIQFYSGTQKKKAEVNIKELQQLDIFCEHLKNQYDFTVKELEYGPGLWISYFGENAYKNDYEMLQGFLTELEKLKTKYHITLEMGRYLAATCGVYVSKIVDVKVHCEQQYCIIDGGINHINYYGQTMAMKIPAYAYLKSDGTIVKKYEWLENHNTDAAKSMLDNNQSKWTICGSLCTVADVIVKNLPIGSPDKGDLIIFYNIGAYSVTEGIYLFLSRTLPKVLMYDKDDKVEMLRDFLESNIINSRNFVLNHHILLD